MTFGTNKIVKKIRIGLFSFASIQYWEMIYFQQTKIEVEIETKDGVQP